MFDDPFYQTHLGEIFQQSNCMQHEHAIANLFSSFLTNLGYKKTQDNTRSWQHNDKKIIICLADDFGVCRTDYNTAPCDWFDSNTVIITDNYMPLPTNYKIIQLPNSYFGIFNYIPANQQYHPARRFNFSVNRFDQQRLILLLELTKQSGGIHQVQTNDYINFNARTFENQNLQDLKNNLDQAWAQSSQLMTEDYQNYFTQIKNQVPIRNHGLTVEQAQIGAYLNLVIETYAGDATIALSEKIFRALLTPSPWAVFSAKNAVKYLQTLGFDVLEDIVDHSYDSLQQDNSVNGQDKISKFIKINLQNYQNLKSMDLKILTDRCLRAASHNQQLLAQMQQSWPADFARWLPGVIEKFNKYNTGVSHERKHITPTETKLN
jgi:hypothetical protein